MSSDDAGDDGTGVDSDTKTDLVAIEIVHGDVVADANSERGDGESMVGSGVWHTRNTMYSSPTVLIFSRPSSATNPSKVEKMLLRSPTSRDGMHIGRHWSEADNVCE